MIESPRGSRVWSGADTIDTWQRPEGEAVRFWAKVRTRTNQNNHDSGFDCQVADAPILTNGRGGHGGAVENLKVRRTTEITEESPDVIGGVNMARGYESAVDPHHSSSQDRLSHGRRRYHNEPANEDLAVF